MQKICYNKYKKNVFWGGVILGLIPGMGSFYSGRKIKGVLFFLVTLILYGVSGCGPYETFLAIAFGVSIWLTGINDVKNYNSKLHADLFSIGK
jgi:hypothetical protein